jgi:hypothetical protein
MLFQFGLMNQRADLMKHVVNSNSQHLTAGFIGSFIDVFLAVPFI